MIAVLGLHNTHDGVGLAGDSDYDDGQRERAEL